MHAFPHQYVVNASLEADGDILLDSPGLERLRSAAPREFDGPGTLWSPETLLTAAVADCLALTFRGVARARRLPFDSFRCDVEGTLDRVNGRTVFTRFRIRAHLRVPDDVPLADAERALERAKDTCLVTNSMTASVEFSADVMADAPVPATSR